LVESFKCFKVGDYHSQLHLIDLCWLETYGPNHNMMIVFSNFNSVTPVLGKHFMCSYREGYSCSTGVKYHLDRKVPRYTICTS